MGKAELASSEQWLANYRAGSSFYFASPEHTLLATGSKLRLTEYKGDNSQCDLPSRVNRLLDEAMAFGDGPAAVVGAIPFDMEKEACLVVPEKMMWGGPLDSPGELIVDPVPAGSCGVQAVPASASYQEAVARALEKMRVGELEKVVLSRSLDVSLPVPADVPRLLRNLALGNPGGYTFAADLTPAAGESGGTQAIRTLIGASPELLVKKKGRFLVANPLAGSAARSGDPEEDKRRADRLLHSPKDLHEHAVVIEAVIAALRPFCSRLDVPEGPSVISTRNMLHLSTVISGELADPRTGSLQLAAALHPTPAVCGAPRQAARQAIRELEGFDRGFFTGMVGWCLANGDGEWAVTIRCAEAEGKSLRLYAGAGIVEGSDPSSEFAETSAKLGTMLAALGLDRKILESNGGN